MNKTISQFTGDTVSFKGNGGITFTANGKELTIVGDQYDVSAAAGSNKATVSLTSTQGHNSSFTVAGAKANVRVTAGANNDITIDADDTKVTNTTAFAPVANNGNGYNLNIVQSDQSSIPVAFDPVIHYGETGAEDAHFKGGVATLNVYSKDDINKKMQALDALHYIGLVGEGGSSLASLTHLHIGDVYKVSSAINVGGQTLKAGDIIIANGTEYKDGDTMQSGYQVGEIDPSTLSWDVIPSGDEEVQHVFQAMSGHGIQLVAPGSNVTGSFEIKAANNGVAITSSNVTRGKEVNIGHRATADIPSSEITAASATGTATEQTQQPCTTMSPFTVVTGVKKDAYGHITTVDTASVTLRDTNITINSLTDTVANVTRVDSAKEVSVTTAIAATNGDGATPQNKQASFSIVSNNLDVSTVDGKAQINLYWGTF